MRAHAQNLFILEVKVLWSIPVLICTEVASIPGRVFAFITVRRTTGPGTSCLRMRQIFIVFVVGKDI